MFNLPAADATLQLMLSFGTLLQIISAILLYTAAFVTLLVVSTVCVALGDSLHKGLRAMSARAARVPVLAKARVWEVKSRFTHAS